MYVNVPSNNYKQSSNHWYFGRRARQRFVGEVMRKTYNNGLRFSSNLGF